MQLILVHAIELSGSQKLILGERKGVSSVSATVAEGKTVRSSSSRGSHCWLS